MPLDTVASSNRTTAEMTTVMNNDEILRSIVILDGIDTDTNVAYARTSTMSESQDIRKNTMTTPNTEAAGGCNYNRHTSTSSMMMMMSGDSAAHGRLSLVVEGTAAGGEEEMAMQDDTAEDDGDEDYVINDMYDSIT